MEVHKGNRNKASSAKMSFLSDIHLGACQMSSRVAFNVLHNYSACQCFFLRFQIIHQGTIALVIYEYLQILTNYSIFRRKSSVT